MKEIIVKHFVTWSILLLSINLSAAELSDLNTYNCSVSVCGEGTGYPHENFDKKIKASDEKLAVSLAYLFTADIGNGGYIERCLKTAKLKCKPE